MLIPLHTLVQKYNLKITGVLHIGAHECEEKAAYNDEGVNDVNIIWLEANENLVKQNINPKVRIYQAVVSDENNKLVDFMVTNNGQSSSILEFGTHKDSYPNIIETQRIPLKTTTIDTFFEKHPEIDKKPINFLNIDIQGAELQALKGMTGLLPQLDALYLEVNTAEVYKGCALLPEIDAWLLDKEFVRVEICMTDAFWGDALWIKALRS